MTVVIERELELHNDETAEPAFVRVHAPEPHEENDWECRLELSWHHRDFKIYGVDAWQALYLAMRTAPHIISATDPFKEGRIGLWGEIQSYEHLCQLFDTSPV